MPNPEQRGSGRTTQAMRTAPKGAIYVWVNHHFDYPRALAKKLGRDDLRIVSPSFFLEQFRGFDRVVWVDHAVSFTQEQLDGYSFYMSQYRARNLW